MHNIKGKKSRSVQKVKKVNDWEGLNIGFVKSVFDRSGRELKKLTKEELLEEFVKKDYINMHAYLNTKIDLHSGYTQLKNEALKLSKNNIIEYIMSADDIIEDKDEDDDDNEDNEDENVSKKNDEDIFFSMLKGFFIPKEEIDKIKSKKIKFREFKKLINRYILSMHPDRGAGSDVEKKIKNEIILEYNENRNSIMNFAKEYLK